MKFSFIFDFGKRHQMFDLHNKEKEKQIGINICKGTYAKYCVSRRYIADFILHQYNLSDISVKEVDKQFIVDYETWLITTYAYSKNYIITIP